MREALSLTYEIEPLNVSSEEVKDLQGLLVLLNTGHQFLEVEQDFSFIIEKLNLAEIDLLVYTMKTNSE